MQVKLNRGPMKNQRVHAPDDSYRYVVRVPIWDGPLSGPPASWEDSYGIGFTYREGEYHKSFTRLNDGTVIFEWMGWLDGKPDHGDKRARPRRRPRAQPYLGIQW